MYFTDFDLTSISCELVFKHKDVSGEKKNFYEAVHLTSFYWIRIYCILHTKVK